MKRVRIPPKCDEAELSYEHNDGQEAHYAEKVDLYDKLIKTNPNLERKGDTIPCTSLNGDMFTYLSKSGSVAFRRNTPQFRAHSSENRRVEQVS